MTDYCVCWLRCYDVVPKIDGRSRNMMDYCVCLLVAMFAMELSCVRLALHHREAAFGRLPFFSFFPPPFLKPKVEPEVTGPRVSPHSTAA